eukprot:TRINITY_DN10742_c0_g2_i2.p1 TRINITY_DN10742_c0_g2~~TRINITY_DN10742_c0_g2_i2.p1  ORF type:complete len:298 (-),score=43.77 TRINITY_DN10742_c0_g2_i2:869-1693(-)
MACSRPVSSVWKLFMLSMAILDFKAVRLEADEKKCESDGAAVSHEQKQQKVSELSARATNVSVIPSAIAHTDEQATQCESEKIGWCNDIVGCATKKGPTDCVNGGCFCRAEHCFYNGECLTLAQASEKLFETIASEKCEKKVETFLADAKSKGTAGALLKAVDKKSSLPPLEYAMYKKSGKVELLQLLVAASPDVLQGAAGRAALNRAVDKAAKDRRFGYSEHEHVANRLLVLANEHGFLDGILKVWRAGLETDDFKHKVVTLIESEVNPSAKI